MSVFGVPRSFAPARVVRTAIVALLATAPFTTSKSCPLFAEEGITHCRRGSLAVYRAANRKQLFEWIGPASMHLEWPRTDRNRSALVSLRVVPTGMSQVRRIASLVPITGLLLCGVALADEDLTFVVEACPGLQTLVLRHPSSLSTDELSDVTDDEQALFKSRTLSGNSLAGLSQLKHVTALEIAGYSLPATRLQFLAGLQQLETLALCDMKITDEDLQSLPNLPSLELLDLSGTSVTGSGLRHLRDCRSLKRIVLNRTPATDELANYLKGDLAPPVEQLHVHGCRITPAGMAALKTALPFTELVESDQSWASATPPPPHNAQKIRFYRAACGLLQDTNVAGFYLSGNVVTGVEIHPDRQRETGDWVFDYLSQVKGIKSLWLAGCKLSAAAIEPLQVQDQLEYLDLSNSSIDDAGIAHLVRLQRLTAIDLQRTTVTDAAAESLSKLRNLDHLHLADTKVTDRGIRALQSLRQLKFLSVQNCQITDEGARQLADMSSLETIALGGTQVTDRTVGALVQLPRLKGLNLANCNITDAGAVKLLEAKNLEMYALGGTFVSEDLAMKVQQHVSEVLARTHPKKSPAISAVAPPLHNYLNETEKKDGSAISRPTSPLDKSILKSPLEDDLDQQKKGSSE
jgi:Leucine-rich repeat (LRR) protein